MKVKICGITTIDDALMAIDCGADMLGFIFAHSPRQVTVALVERILNMVAKLRPSNAIETIGVFVNTPGEEINTVLSQTGLQTAQLHGDESSMVANAYEFPWYKAVRFRSNIDVDTLFRDNTMNWSCSRLLVDTALPGVFGGTGIAVDAALAHYAKEKILDNKREFFIAGGINPQNVGLIQKTLTPNGIDVSSGVEECPGKKSLLKMEALFKQIHV